MNSVIMPLPPIKYICKNCGHIFKPLIPGIFKKCPKCGSNDVKLDFSLDPPHNGPIVF